jgi:hypothetical protein
MMDAFLRWCFGDWWTREAEPEDYPEGSDWREWHPPGLFKV